jgi:hypothetical protein
MYGDDPSVSIFGISNEVAYRFHPVYERIIIIDREYEIGVVNKIFIAQKIAVMFVMSAKRVFGGASLYNREITISKLWRPLRGLFLIRKHAMNVFCQENVRKVIIRNSRFYS